MNINYDFGTDDRSEELTLNVNAWEAVALCYDRIINNYMPEGVWETMDETQKQGVRDMLKDFLKDFDLEEDVVDAYADELSKDYEREAWQAYKDGKSSDASLYGAKKR